MLETYFAAPKTLERLRAGPSGSSMTRRLARAAPAGLVVSLAIAGAEAQPACAQDMSALSGMQFFVTPYLWLSGINTAIKTPLARAPEVNSDVSAIDLLSHLNGVPFAAHLGHFLHSRGAEHWPTSIYRPSSSICEPAAVHGRRGEGAPPTNRTLKAVFDKGSANNSGSAV